MKRLLIVLALLGLVVSAHLRGWFVPGPPQVLEYAGELNALQAEMYSYMDPVTKRKWDSMGRKPQFKKVTKSDKDSYGRPRCSRDIQGSTEDGKVLYICKSLLENELVLVLAHLVDHAVLMNQGVTDHDKLDRSARLAECDALRHINPIAFDKFPICRASREDVLNGRFKLSINQVLGRDLTYTTGMEDQKQEP